MHIERKLNSRTGRVELWECEWEYEGDVSANKRFLKKICDEEPLAPDGDDAWNEVKAICWASDRTLGNIAAFSESMLGSFPEKHGSDALLPCDIVNAGKFRHGADRWWCRTHQAHWGTKADIASYEQMGQLRCSNYEQRLNYVVEPLEIDIDEYGEVGLWCSMPSALSSGQIKTRPPRIHLHLRDKQGDLVKLVDRDFPAISIVYKQHLGMFENEKITRIHVTPPAAWEFVLAIEEERELDCVSCNKCGYPHLDLGDFAKKPHRKHFCGNCGIDSIWSKEPIVSTPLKTLYDQHANAKGFEVPERALNMDDYPDAEYEIWASTPAVLWTAHRNQEKGIHVHIDQEGHRVVDETFGEVIKDGKLLDRRELLTEMMRRIE